jgi:hypothetical protein
METALFRGKPDRDAGRRHALRPRDPSSSYHARTGALKSEPRQSAHRQCTRIHRGSPSRTARLLALCSEPGTGRRTPKSRLSIKPLDTQLITAWRDLASHVRSTGRISANPNVENHSSGGQQPMAPASCRQTGGRLGCRNREHLAVCTGLRQTSRNRHQGGYVYR